MLKREERRAATEAKRKVVRETFALTVAERVKAYQESQPTCDKTGPSQARTSHTTPVIVKDVKSKRHRDKLKAQGLCPCCSQPCAPYQECEKRRKRRSLVVAMHAQNVFKEEDIAHCAEVYARGTHKGLPCDRLATQSVNDRWLCGLHATAIKLKMKNALSPAKVRPKKTHKPAIPLPPATSKPALTTTNPTPIATPHPSLSPSPAPATRTPITRQILPHETPLSWYYPKTANPCPVCHGSGKETTPKGTYPCDTCKTRGFVYSRA